MPRETTCPVCGGPLHGLAFTLIPERGVVVGDGGFVVLTGIEMKVLAALADKWPRVLSKEQIMDAVYDLTDDEPMMKIVDVFICKLRKKLAPLGVSITTSWGQGYALGQKPVVAA